MRDLNVAAVVPAEPEPTGAIVAALQTLNVATRVAAGCVEYDVFESAAAPGTFITIER